MIRGATTAASSAAATAARSAASGSSTRAGGKQKPEDRRRRRSRGRSRLRHGQSALCGSAPGGAERRASWTSPARSIPRRLRFMTNWPEAGPALQVLPETREAVVETYRKRGFRPVWLENGALRPAARRCWRCSPRRPRRASTPPPTCPPGLTGFEQPLPVHDQAAMARLDIDLFAAALRYARDASGGLFDPRKLSRYHDVGPPPVAADRRPRWWPGRPIRRNISRACTPPTPPMPR